MGMRIDASAADQRFFFPSHCRLKTLGFDELEAWTLSEEAGEEVGIESPGRDADVRVRSNTAGISAWIGDSRWVAQRHLAAGSRAIANERGVFCEIDVSRLSSLRTKPKRFAVLELRPTRAPEIPGQLSLVR